MELSIKMPALQDGRVYRHDDPEIADCIGQQDGATANDYFIFAQRFPIDPETRRYDGLHSRTPSGEWPVLQYRVHPMSDFEEQIAELDCLFSAREAHRRRVQIIVDILRAGKTFFPVLIHQNDSAREIMEGNHRSVALRQLGSPCIAAFHVGYANWFVS
jgi:hypothetical protein